MANSILAKMAVQIVANNAKFNAAMKQSQAQMRGFQKTAQTVQTSLASFGVGLGIYEVARVVQNAVGIMADFEHSMSEVRAITGATGKEFKALEDDALRLGRTTKFTASQVSSLQVAYGRLGFSTQEILDATEATLDLAAATGEDLAKAADVAGSTVRGFGLDASETLRVTDVMASSFNKSALSLENFTESMKYVAPVANAAGATVEETTALLGVLADAGIRGSQAGTSLRRIFTDLTKDGRPLSVRLEELAKKGLTLSGSMDEIGRLGSTSLLVLSKNTEKTKELTKALGNAAGEAHKMAEIMQDDLTGDVTKLSSAYQGLILKLGEGSDSMREFVQAITKFVTLLSDDSIIKGIKAWISVVSVVPRKTLDLVNGILDAFKEEGDAFAEMAEKRRKIWEDKIKKDLNAEKKAIEDNTAALRRQEEAYKAVLKAAEWQNPKVKRGASSEGDEFYHRDIDMNPNSGLFGIFERPFDPVPGIIEEIEYNNELAASLDRINELREAQIDKMQATAEMAVTMGDAIGSAFEGMLSGTMNFAQGLARVSEEIITMYLKQSIAAMIASAIKDPSTPFPFAKVAIAAAGIGAVKALFSQIGGSGGGIGGGVGRGGMSAPGLTPSEYSNSRGGYRIRGYDLELVAEKERYRRSRVG